LHELDKVAFIQAKEFDYLDSDDIPENQKFTLALTLFTSLMINNQCILETFENMNGFTQL